jgi:hypothetical protein
VFATVATDGRTEAESFDDGTIDSAASIYTRFALGSTTNSPVSLSRYASAFPPALDTPHDAPD